MFINCFVVWKALTYKFALENHQYLQSLERDMIVDDISDIGTFTFVQVSWNDTLTKEGNFLHRSSRRIQGDMHRVTQRWLDDLDDLISPSEVWIVPRWTQCPWRINAWTAAGSALRATRVRCRPCWTKKFLHISIWRSVNIGESPVLLKSNSVIQSVFSVHFPSFNECLNGRVSTFFFGCDWTKGIKVTQVDCYLSSYCSSEPSLQGCSKQDRRVDESSHGSVPNRDQYKSKVQIERTERESISSPNDT